MSHSAEDLREQVARAVAAGHRYILALGGDGTFHHLANVVCRTDVIAGFLPAGNGNDVALALGIPRNALRAAEVFLRSEPLTIDLIRVKFATGRVEHCVCTAGAGLDAEAAHLANTRFRNFPGTARYLAGVASAFSRRVPVDLHANVDGEEWCGCALLALVANTPEYGAGIRIAPAAKLDDGRLEAVVVRNVSWSRFLRAIPILLTSGNVRMQELERFPCKRLAVHAPAGMKVHGDGEILGESPVEFEVAPGALRVMAPKPAGI